jgi:hypothetical protein
MVKVCVKSGKRSVYIGEWKGTRNAVFASCADRLTGACSLRFTMLIKLAGKYLQGRVTNQRRH